MKNLLISFVVLLLVVPFLADPINKPRVKIEDDNRLKEEDSVNELRVVDKSRRVKREEDDVDKVWAHVGGGEL